MVRLFSSIDDQYTVYIRYIINCYYVLWHKIAFDNKENYYDYYKDKNN